VLLIDSSCDRPGAGATMIRLAARLRAGGVAPLVAACFLADARPTFAEALEGCVRRGATEVVLAPFTLGANSFVREELPRLCDAARAAYAHVTVRAARPLEDHPTVSQMVLQRAVEADYIASHPLVATAPGAAGPEQWRPMYRQFSEREGGERKHADDMWLPLYASHQTALLLADPNEDRATSDSSIGLVAERIRRLRRYALVRVCSMAYAEPRVGPALDDLLRRGIRHAIIVPCTLRSADPLLAALVSGVAHAREQHADLTVILAEHLAYDRRLVDAIGDRVSEALGLSLPPEAPQVRLGASE
jgi:sirohydrochlorin cobaltochelatase